MLRVTVLKAKGGGIDALLAYYAGLAQDQQSRDGAGRGPVDYYLDPDEPPGRWWGAGRPGLGLDGEVTPEQLSALLTARHPETGKWLGRRFREDGVRGFDATFSAPKSVSVLWALSPDPFVRAEVAAAHDAAVTAALAWLERHGAVTRRGTNGVDQVDTQGLTVALFRQHTSRSADPQLHTHAVIAAKVQDPTGRWLSLDARFLLKQQRSIGWVYDAALRAELTGRLGVDWEPIAEGFGQSDIVGIPEELRSLFSQRSAQIEEKLVELLDRWMAEHDGAEPDRRTIARLTRKAVLASRPPKGEGAAAVALRAEWVERAIAAGFDPAALPTARREPETVIALDADTVIAQAIERVGGESSTWLRADLARELATLVPPGVAADGEALAVLLDALAERAAARCVELHPPSPLGAPKRRDGRPVSEHVTDRALTTRAILDQEARLLTWARQAVGGDGRGSAVIDAPGLTESQGKAAAAVAGEADLVLVVGPAGTGKTTALAAAVEALHRESRPVMGLAPSGKAADVLATEAGCPTATLAKLLYEHARPAGPRPAWALPAGTTVVVDEAAMASTDDLDHLVVLAQMHQWRIACVGDPDQLPAVGRGGMFAHWCDTLPAHYLDEVQRFEEPWQAEASLGLRRGDPDAAAEYAARKRVRAVHPGLVADQVASLHENLTGRGETLAITTARTETARAINRAIQHRRGTWRSRAGVRLADGTYAFAGDQIATRRNDPELESTTGATVRNRHTWTVAAVHRDGSLTVEHPEWGAVVLPAAYAADYVELGWAVTEYGTQGITTDHGVCVVEPTSTRAGVYVGMTRGRRRNLALVLDPSGDADTAEALAAVLQRPPRGLTAHVVREHLYARQGLAVPHEPPLARDEVERMRAYLDRLQAAPGPSREPPGIAL